jgi:DMSO/TMAO reductase YedYZ molybdopterin-dependent catalytic subunit
MALFVVRHQHPPEHCPAVEPLAGASLLNHLSRGNVRRHGVEIHGEAVVSGEHTLFLIVEAASQGQVESFMAPFAQAGQVQVFPASTCARVVASGGCAAPLPEVDAAGPALDPEDACQRAIDAGLLVHRAHPLNGETSIDALIGGVVMPSAHFYVRNHFQIPDLDPATWRLRIGGRVARPLSLSLRELQQMPSHTHFVTLECAGNGRSRLDPPAPGEQWQLGAVSTAEWTGVSLAELLDRAGAEPSAREVVFRGADRGEVDGRDGPIHFERSLSIDDARSSEALLAYAMNGEALPPAHGYPVRLVVPDWYGVASVKWLTDVEVIDGTFDGFFQADRYQYETERDGEIVREPVTVQRVRALVTEPRPEQVLAAGEVVVRGVAWSGAAGIARVEIAVGDGPWQPARLVGHRNRHAWQWWEAGVVVAPGPTTLRARATDLAGRCQPDVPEWNRLGYGANQVHTVPVEVLG